MGHVLGVALLETGNTSNLFLVMTASGVWYIRAQCCHYILTGEITREGDNGEPAKLLVKARFCNELWTWRRAHGWGGAVLVLCWWAGSPYIKWVIIIVPCTVEPPHSPTVLRHVWRLQPDPHWGLWLNQQSGLLSGGEEGPRQEEQVVPRGGAEVRRAGRLQDQVKYW